MSDRLLVATRKGLFDLRRHGAGDWRIAATAFLGDPVTALLAPGGDAPWLAALDHGHFGVKLHRSADRGQQWEECAVPAYPPRPDDQPEEIDPVRGEPIPWALKRIWALAAAAGDLWCGTLPGGLFRSGDGGDSWELNRPLWELPERRRWMGGGADWPGIHSILVDPRDPRRVTVAVSVGGVWHSDDGGADWHPRCAGLWAAYMPPEQKHDPVAQDLHRVVACPAAPDTLWAQHHNGIFHSGDGGRQWREVERAGPSTFGFAVAVHPDDPQTAWFVPATKDEKRYAPDGRVVVTRTRDSGASFDVLTDGLPQQHAYDLVYRHALDVDGRGQRLAFGSTTGSLWLSEDQGDRWQQISAQLPPVYALRFAGD
jgi:hypothetical protein